MSEEAEYAKGCECDSCCRLSELAVVFGLADSCDTADEIAGMVKRIHEGMEEQVIASWERDRVSRERERQALERAAKAIEDLAASEKYEAESCNCPDACIHAAFDAAEQAVRELIPGGK